MVANAIKMYLRNNKIQLSAGEDVFADGHVSKDRLRKCT